MDFRVSLIGTPSKNYAIRIVKLWQGKLKTMPSKISIRFFNDFFSFYTLEKKKNYFRFPKKSEIFFWV